MSNDWSRRLFLRFLAASPSLSAAQQNALMNGEISDLKDALNVLDFEPAARKAIPPAHFGFLTTGVDDDLTVKANREGFNRIHTRPRRLVDVSNVDTSVELFGSTWETPIILAPVASQKAFHSEGEIAVARAANAKRHLQILSTVTSTSVEDVAKAHTRPIWFQLYPTSRWSITEKVVRRAENAGCPVLVLTVDTQAGRNTETEVRFKRTDTRPCNACHTVAPPGLYTRPKPMFDGIDVAGVRMSDPTQTWDVIRRLRGINRMKLLIKGIETHEDARLCREHGVDGIIVSNHGGRAAESARGSIDCLPEIVDAAGSAMPILIDGGFRRGTDVFKALALGAKAICIGRPYIWGLGAFGQPGVERVLEILRAELSLAMRQCGARSIAEISRSFVGFNVDRTR